MEIWFSFRLEQILIYALIWKLFWLYFYELVRIAFFTKPNTLFELQNQEFEAKEKMSKWISKQIEPFRGSADAGVPASNLLREVDLQLRLIGLHKLDVGLQMRDVRSQLSDVMTLKFIDSNKLFKYILI